MSIEFYTSDELVEELMKRKTFLGIIIRSEQEMTSNSGVPDGFQMGCRNVTPDQAITILKSITESLESDIENGGGPEWHCED